MKPTAPSTTTRTTCAVLLAAGLACAAPIAAAPTGWLIDPTHTFVTAEVLHQGLSTLRVRFDRKQAELQFDRAARAGRVRFVLEIGSLSTGAPALDAWLKGPAALDAEAHRQAVFSAEGFRFQGDAVSAVEGRLAWRGRTQPLLLTAERFNCYTSPLFKREVCGGDFSGRLSLRDWGIGNAAGVLADAVVLQVQIEAVLAP